MASTVGIFLFVIVQRASVPWLLQRAKVDGAYPFAVNSIVVAVTFAELLLGVGLACCGAGLRRGLADALNPREIRKWFILGISQAASDMLELYANKYLDASTYQVLLQSKLLVTALLMLATVRGATQSGLEWLLLTALSLGLTTYSILSNGSGSFSGIGTAMAVLKVVLSCVNAVFTEKILKQSQGTPVIHQIVHMKVFWCLWSVVFMGLLEGPSVFVPSNFFHGWNACVGLVITTYIVKNWSGTFLLKRLDSLLKNIAEAFAMLVLYMMEILPIVGSGRDFELPTFCVTMLVVLLVAAYLESKKSARAEATGKQVHLTELLAQPLVLARPGTPPWARDGRRLGRKYGLLPSSTPRCPQKFASGCRIVPNKNASFGSLPPADLSRNASLADLKQSASHADLSRNASYGSDLNKAAPALPQKAAELRRPAPVSVGKTHSEPEPEDLEESLATVRPHVEGPAPKYNETFGVLDTVQVLLREALEGDGSEWKGSVTQALNICQKLRPYLEAMSSKVSPQCEAIAALTQQADWAELHRTGVTKFLYHSGMMTPQYQGQVLGFFASMLSARNILEVGMFTGFTTLCMAEAAQPQSKVTAIELDPYLAELAKKAFAESPHGDKIEVIRGDALDVLGEMPVASDDGARFDLIFIDGNKTQYARYFELINSRDLLAPGGLICIDDSLWKGCVYDGSNPRGEVDGASAGVSDQVVAEAMRELNQAIAGDPRLVSVLLPICNGLTLIRRLDDQASGDRDHFGGILPKPLPVRRPTMQQPGPLGLRGRPAALPDRLGKELRAGSPSATSAAADAVTPLQSAQHGRKASPKGSPRYRNKFSFGEEWELGPPVAASSPVRMTMEEGGLPPHRELTREWSEETEEMALPIIDSIATRLQTC